LACCCLISAAVALSGCSGSLFGSEETSSIENAAPADKLYAEGEALLAAGSYEDAAQRFEDVERNYPFSNDPQRPYARKSLALAAYAYFKAEKYDDAIAAGKRYTSMHAGTEDAALAHHVVAMSYYAQIQEAQYDQTFTKKAIEEFRSLIRLYPDSTFVAEDRNRLRIAEDMLAGSEMNVGRYYMKKANYLAAINRFKAVVTEHQRTAHVEEALTRLTECYLALGIQDEARTAAAILGHNFPDSQWYKDAYALLSRDGLSPHENTESDLSKAWHTAVQTVDSQGTPQATTAQ
jgi:outer membrane protein assembly factor BamD